MSKYRQLEVKVNFDDGESTIFSGFTTKWREVAADMLHAYCMESIREDWAIEVDYTSDGGTFMEVNRWVIKIVAWPDGSTVSEVRRFVNKMARRSYRYCQKIRP